MPPCPSSFFSFSSWKWKIKYWSAVCVPKYQWKVLPASSKRHWAQPLLKITIFLFLLPVFFFFFLALLCFPKSRDHSKVGIKSSHHVLAFSAATETLSSGDSTDQLKVFWQPRSYPGHRRVMQQTTILVISSSLSSSADAIPYQLSSRDLGDYVSCDHEAPASYPKTVIGEVFLTRLFKQFHPTFGRVCCCCLLEDNIWNGHILSSWFGMCGLCFVFAF